jgi:hypothetical protein
VLLGVICIFVGGIVSGRPGIADGPRPVRAVAASLLLTGGLLVLAGGAAYLLQRGRRSGASLSLAPPSGPEHQPLSSFLEEEQR